MKENNNTETSFRDKWNNNKDLAFEETLRMGSEIQNWILNRNGWNDTIQLKKFLADKKRILDAGCGNGRVTALLREYAVPSSQIVGIDLVANDVARNNLKKYSNIEIYAADLLRDNLQYGKFDFIYCQEVLHHTNDPEAGFKNLVSNNLENGGIIAIYVYKKKAVIREYVDDYIRNAIKTLPYADAKKTTDQITQLGKSLSDIKIKINVPDVEMLGIEKGEYDIQRFVYHFFMKCFWNDNLSFDANSVINYDWYHPQNCERYTTEEIREWFKRNDLKIVHEFTDHYGITMHGIKYSLCKE